MALTGRTLSSQLQMPPAAASIEQAGVQPFAQCRFALCSDSEPFLRIPAAYPRAAHPAWRPEKIMAAHADDIELVIEIIHDSTGNNPKAHYRLFVGGNPVEYSELIGVKNVLAQALVSHILASRMASLKNAGATPGAHH